MSIFNFLHHKKEAPTAFPSSQPLKTTETHSSTYQQKTKDDSFRLAAQLGNELTTSNPVKEEYKEIKQHLSAPEIPPHEFFEHENLIRKTSDHQSELPSFKKPSSSQPVSKTSSTNQSSKEESKERGLLSKYTFDENPKTKKQPSSTQTKSPTASQINKGYKHISELSPSKISFPETDFSSLKPRIPAGPIFTRINNYKDALATINKIKILLQKDSKIISSTISEQESTKLFETLNSQAEELQKKLMYADYICFEKQNA